MRVIPNGFDTARLTPNPDAGSLIRRELGARDGDVLIGLVARFDPQKDHHTFFRAAGMLAKRFPQAAFVLCGSDVTAENAPLVHMATSEGVFERTHFLGARNDVPAIMSALDVAVSSSAYGEGFPNVLAEAMACGVPCVATDVGDSAAIIGDTGFIVPIRSPELLAERIGRVVEMPAPTRSALGRKARERIVNNFSMATAVGRFEGLYEELVAAKSHNS